MAYCKLSNMNPIKNVGKLRCSGRVGSSCSTSGTYHVTLDTNPVITSIVLSMLTLYFIYCCDDVWSF